MQKQDEITVRGEGADWLLSISAVRVHDRHIQGGRANVRSCGICQEGLGGAMAEDATYAAKEPELVEGNGSDEKEDPAPSPDNWPRSG